MHAPYLAHLLTQPTESETRIIMLEDVEIAVFEMWLPHVNIVPEHPVPRLPDTFETTAKLYVLAQRLGDVQTRNRLMFSVAERMTRLVIMPTVADVNMIWDGTPATSPMRRLVVLCWAMYGDQNVLRVSSSKFPEDFFVQLSLLLMSIRYQNTWHYGQWHSGMQKIALSLMEKD